MSDTSSVDCFDISSSEEDYLEGVVFGVRPYDYEPIAEGDAKSDGEVKSSPPFSPRPERLLSTEWCTCAHCTIMDSDVECVCCHEKEAVDAKILRRNGHSCVSDNPEFTVYCLTRFILDVEYKKLAHYHPRYTDIDDMNARYRYTAYRQFVWWAFGELGSGNRVVLPSCVVNRIRKAFPSLEYTGFKWM